MVVSMGKYKFPKTKKWNGKKYHMYRANGGYYIPVKSNADAICQRLKRQKNLCRVIKTKKGWVVFRHFKVGGW